MRRADRRPHVIEIETRTKVSIPSVNAVAASEFRQPSDRAEERGQVD